MKRTNQRYAQIRNKGRGGSGKLFEQSFESEPVSDLKHLATVLMYIEANPHNAGLINCWRYRWSSYGLHARLDGVGSICSDLIVFDHWYLSLGDTYEERSSAYTQLFADYVARRQAAGAGGREPSAYTRRLLRPDGSSASESGFYVSSENQSDSGGVKG